MVDNGKAMIGHKAKCSVCNKRLCTIQHPIRGIELVCPTCSSVIAIRWPIGRDPSITTVVRKGRKDTS